MYGKKALNVIIAVFSLFMLIFGGQSTLAKEQPVVIVTIRGEIDAAQAALLHRAYREAAAQNAKGIIMEMDTFGGLVDAAVQMRDTIIESPLPTVCYIKNRAWSAGALIAIAHKEIAMAPGSSIGAAEPIPATEKTIAALKAEFAATANRTGRDSKVAEAMVDKTKGLPGYAEPGQIVALTDEQARALGYAKYAAADRTALLESLGWAGSPVLEYQMQWTERAAGWLSSAAVQSILVSILFLAVMTEIKTAGSGIAGLIGLLAAGLLFGSQWLTGFASWLEILLFFAGILLVVMEFYVPGGILGAIGIGCIIGSLFLTLGGNAEAAYLLLVSLAAALVAFLLLVRYLPSSRIWEKTILTTAHSTQAGFTTSDDYRRYLGRQGVVVSLLRPAGTVRIDGSLLDVVSEGQYIEAGVTVEIVRVDGGRIVVRPTESQE